MTIAIMTKEYFYHLYDKTCTEQHHVVLKYLKSILQQIDTTFTAPRVINKLKTSHITCILKHLIYTVICKWCI